MSRRGTTESFKIRAEEIHGDTYNYDKSVYVTNATLMTITCKKHGDFEQIPNSHLLGVGCFACGVGGNGKGDTESFISKAMTKHGNAYSYEKTTYILNKTKVIITCKKHGDFKQTPSYFLSQRGGCSKCKIDRKRVLAEIDFKKRASVVHNNKYDYSKVKYGGTKVTIICPEHGEFEQRPSDHSSQHNGCPKCTTGGFNPAKPAVFYVYNIDDMYVGFGISNNFESRDERHMNNLSRAGLEASLIDTIYFERGSDALEIESHVKREFIQVDTGVAGFRTEAISINYLNELMVTLKHHYIGFGVKGKR